MYTEVIVYSRSHCHRNTKYMHKTITGLGNYHYQFLEQVTSVLRIQLPLECVRHSNPLEYNSI